MAARLKTQPVDPDFFGHRDDTALVWLGSAGLLVNARGTILLVDPVIARVKKDGELRSETGHRLKVDLPIEAEGVPRADAVLYTHADGDHFGARTAEVLTERLQPLFIAAPPVADRLRRIGAQRITVAEDFAAHEIGCVKIDITPALHDWQPENPWVRGDCCGYVIRTPDGTVWHPGDSRLIDELLTVRDIDVLMFDVARARAHLGPEGSARLAETCGAKKMIAYHYGTYDVPPGGPFGCDPEDCSGFVRGLDAQFLTPNPGEPLVMRH